jgi:PIN domain nuclease of toxin-antitoxin system
MKGKRNFLLDTHVLIWLMAGKFSTPKFKNKKPTFIDEPCFISVESLKEMALKSSVGKLDIESDPKKLFQQITKFNVSVLDFDKEAVSALFDLPFNKGHLDPFDRSIIAHAISKKMILVSDDSQFRFYQKHGLRLQRL